MILFIEIPSRLPGVKINIKILLLNMNYQFHNFTLIHYKGSISLGSVALYRYFLFITIASDRALMCLKMLPWSIKSTNGSEFWGLLSNSIFKLIGVSILGIYQLVFKKYFCLFSARVLQKPILLKPSEP